MIHTSITDCKGIHVEPRFQFGGDHLQCNSALTRLQIVNSRTDILLLLINLLLQ
jgi:hypothetical protein